MTTETLIRMLLWLLARVTKTQWNDAKNYVQQAAETDWENERKRSFVVSALKDNWPKLALWVLNLLVELANALRKTRQ